MKTTKILTDVLKIAGMEKYNKILYGIDKEYVYYTPDAFRMYKIPQEKFLIDLGKAFPKRVPISDPKKMMDDSEAVEAIKTNEMRSVENFNVIKIKSEKSHAWINVNYLNEFEADCTFKVIGEKSPVFIYEGDELVGMVLPIFIKDK